MAKVKKTQYTGANTARKKVVKKYTSKQQSLLKMMSKFKTKPEVKQQSYFLTNDQSVLTTYTAPTSATYFFTNSIGAVVNDIVQGPGQGDRVGNVITVKNLVVKGCVYTNTSTGPNATAFGITGPVYVDVYLGYRRDLQAIDNRLLQFYNDGDGWISPSGSSKDLLYTVNKDMYVILGKRRLKIGCNTYANSTVSYNDYDQHKTFSFNLSKYVHNKKVYYQDTTVVPTSPWWNALTVFTTVINPATGLPFPAPGATTNVLGVNINFVSTLFYTDQ